MTRKVLYTISAVIYLALMALITLPPFMRLLDRAEPRILGMPCMQFFLLAVPLALAVWLIVWFNLDCKVDDARARRDANEGGEGK